jgi:hypothetical protein
MTGQKFPPVTGLPLRRKNIGSKASAAHSVDDAINDEEAVDQHTERREEEKYRDDAENAVEDSVCHCPVTCPLACRAVLSLKAAISSKDSRKIKKFQMIVYIKK